MTSADWFTRRRIIVVLAVCLFAGAIAVALADRVLAKLRSEPGPLATTVTLQFGPSDLAYLQPARLSRELPVSGAVQPVRQTTVRAKVSGELKEIRVREGEAVRQGQVLARFDTADLEARLADRLGAMEAARAQLKLAEKTRTTNLALLKQNFISQNAFDSADSNLSVNQGGLKSMEAQVQLARNALRDAVVTAPLAGTIAKRHAQPGEKLSFDAPLFTVVDLADMELQAMVPANDIPELESGMPVELAIDGFGDRRFTGSIERINPTTEAGTRAIIVFVQIPNKDRALRGGMFASGKVTLAAGPAVPTLPQTAVRSESGQTVIWSIDNGRLVRRQVVVGARDATSGRIEIRTPIGADLPVLAARVDNLREGAPAVIKPGQAAQPESADSPPASVKATPG